MKDANKAVRGMSRRPKPTESAGKTFGRAEEDLVQFVCYLTPDERRRLKMLSAKTDTPMTRIVSDLIRAELDRRDV